MLETYAPGKLGKIELLTEQASPAPTKGVLRLVLEESPPNYWDAQVRWKLEQPVKKGDVLHLGFWGRTVDAATETGEATLEANMQKFKNWTGFFTRRVSIARGWQHYDFPFVAAEDCAAGEWQFSFNFGYRPQTVELADIRFLNYADTARVKDLPMTRATYEGREPDAPWRKDAAERIRQHRMADLAVEVVDADGRAVPGATVHIAMTRQAFPFGTAVPTFWFMRDEQTPDHARYGEILKRYFNSVTFEGEIKWDGWDDRENHKRRASLRRVTARMMQWIEKNGFVLRGHNMIWPSKGTTWKYLPSDVVEKLDAGDLDYVKTRTMERIFDIGGHFSGRVYEWDVINEPTTERLLMDKLGDDIMVQWLQWAREADPKAVLVVNDFATLSGGALDVKRIERFQSILRYLTDRGAQFDSIGEQAHFGDRPAGIRQSHQLLDSLAAFGKPVVITEFDIATHDEELQAEYTRDFYTLCYSLPYITGITMWGFYESRHWMPSAALWRSDWSLKPNGAAYVDLVSKQWWTDLSVVTDEEGKAHARGFLGNYTLTAQVGNKTTGVDVQLEPAGKKVRIRLP